jgi:hypothetical protein
VATQERGGTDGCGASKAPDAPASHHIPIGAPPAPPLAYAKGGAVYLETYGCQMNTNDSEVVLAILQQRGYHRTEQLQV